jgi:formate-dependent nitrite reductase membrane component NrfD
VGTWILIAYSILAAIWLVLGLRFGDSIAIPIIALAALAGALTACYSGFLFGQAKGRDLWQSPLFLWHLLVQALVAGAASIILLVALDGYAHIGDTADGGQAIIRASNLLLVAAIILNALMILGELLLTPVSADARYAAEVMIRGRMRGQFWLGAIGAGTLLPAGLLFYMLAGGVYLPFEVLAAALVLFGLLIFEKVWITAGQAPPLS